MLKATPLEAQDPRELSGYRLEGRLGEGAQGVVYLGRDRSGDRVAVKVLHARLAGDAEARRRFLQELATSRRVAGFGTAQVLDGDVTGDHPYVVSEYVDGPSLQKMVAEEGPHTGGALERLAVGTAMALAAIHRVGVVHRDFKPGNVLLGPDGPRVIDFGVSRAVDSMATLTVGAVGTPSYMAPEQLGSGNVGPAADVFAWACTMLYAATGSPPFGNDTVAAVMTRVLTAEPDLSGVPEPLAGVVALCLAKDPAARPGIREVLDRVLGEPAGGAATSTPAVPATPTATVIDTTPTGPSTTATGPSAATITSLPFPDAPPPPAAPTVPPDPAPGSGDRRRRWPAVAGALAVLAVLAGTGVWWLGGGDGQQKYTSLTESGCRMVPAATVRKLVPEASVQRVNEGPEEKVGYFRAGCEWRRTGDSSPIWRELSVEVSVHPDVKNPDSLGGEPTDGVRRAKAGLTSARQDFASKANRTEDLGGGNVTYYDPTVELSGIGDEAILLSHHDLAKNGTVYDNEVVDITARLANAEVWVSYSSGAKTGKRIPTPEPVVRKDAETVARSLLESLKNCTGCTR